MKEAAASAGLEFGRPLGRIDRSISRCDRVIGDLLDFTRVRPLRPSRVAADEWLGEVLDEQPLPRDVTIVRRFGGSGCIVAFDAELMRRVVINLIDNAAQALTEMESRDGERLIIVSTRAVGGGYEFSIEDTGPGIGEDVLPKVFEPLFSTKSFGTGLGLPAVKQIVDQHEGAVRISSDAGRGTRVVVQLPRQAGREIAA